jgi:hypothetical protein
MNEGNVGFFVRNSPTSEADQIFDQFISPSHPKHCTKSKTSPPNLKKAGAPAREPKSVREQNHAHGNKSTEQRNKTNGPVRKSPLKIPSVKWEIRGARAPGRRTPIGSLILMVLVNTQGNGPVKLNSGPLMPRQFQPGGRLSSLDVIMRMIATSSRTNSIWSLAHYLTGFNPHRCAVTRLPINCHQSDFVPCMFGHPHWALGVGADEDLWRTPCDH